MLGYVWICHSGFCFIFSHCNPLSTYLNAWLIIFESLNFQRLHKIRSFTVKEKEAVFLETQNLIFLYEL